MRRYTTLGKSIWVIITHGCGNQSDNIEIITSGQATFNIIQVITTTTSDNNPYTIS